MCDDGKEWNVNHLSFADGEALVDDSEERSRKASREICKGV